MGKTAEANVFRQYIEQMKKKTKEMQQAKEMVEQTKCPPGFKYDKKLRQCVPRYVGYAYPFVGSSSSRNGGGDDGSGSGNGNGNGNGGNGNSCWW